MLDLFSLLLSLSVSQVFFLMYVFTWRHSPDNCSQKPIQTSLPWLLSYSYHYKMDSSCLLKCFSAQFSLLCCKIYKSTRSQSSLKSWSRNAFIYTASRKHAPLSCAQLSLWCRNRSGRKCHQCSTVTANAWNSLGQEFSSQVIHQLKRLGRIVGDYIARPVNSVSKLETVGFLWLTEVRW